MDFYRRYLDRLEPDGGFDCACGRRHSIGTRQVLVGEGVLGELPALLRERHGGGLRLSAAAQAGKPDFLAIGNDPPLWTFGWLMPA